QEAADLGAPVVRRGEEGGAPRPQRLIGCLAVGHSRRNGVTDLIGVGGGRETTVGLSAVGPPPLTSRSQVPANRSTTWVTRGPRPPPAPPQGRPPPPRAGAHPPGRVRAGGGRGIDPADGAARRPPVLKTGGATRHPDASAAEATPPGGARHPLHGAASPITRGCSQRILHLTA